MKMTKTTVFYELLTITLMLATILYLLFAWHRIPAQVPSHFSATGDIDAYDEKISVLIMPIVMVVLYMVLTIVAAFPKSWNMPISVNEGNKEYVESIIRTMLASVKLLLVCVFGYITMCTIDVRPLGNGFIYVTVIVLAGLFAYYFIKMWMLQKRTKQRKE